MQAWKCRYVFLRKAQYGKEGAGRAGWGTCTLLCFGGGGAVGSEWAPWEAEHGQGRGRGAVPRSREQ